MRFARLPLVTRLTRVASALFLSEDDPTGKKFLEELLGEKIDEIQKDWLDWIGKQKYER